MLRGVAVGVGFALLGTLGGFLAGLLRRRPPSHYVDDDHAPRAQSDRLPG
jgi:hypothetical protein